MSSVWSERGVLDEARRGTLPGSTRTGATLADAAAEFLRYAEHDRGCRPSTLRDHRSNLEAHLLPTFGSQALESITPASFSPEKVLALVRAAGSVQEGTIYLVAAFMGLRRGELLAVRWRDVDFAGSVIRVRASYAAGHVTTPKSGKVPSVPVAPSPGAGMARAAPQLGWSR